MNTASSAASAASASSAAASASSAAASASGSGAAAASASASVAASSESSSSSSWPSAFSGLTSLSSLAGPLHLRLLASESTWKGLSKEMKQKVSGRRRKNFAGRSK